VLIEAGVDAQARARVAAAADVAEPNSVTLFSPAASPLKNSRIRIAQLQRPFDELLRSARQLSITLMSLSFALFVLALSLRGFVNEDYGSPEFLGVIAFACVLMLSATVVYAVEALILPSKAENPATREGN